MKSRDKKKMQSIETIIGRDACFEGTLSSREGLRIDGKVKGKVLCDGTLVIGSEGKVEAEVVAKDVLIAGELRGNVKAEDLLEITEQGRVYGDITTTQLVISPGVIFEGSCHMASDQEGIEGPVTLPLPRTLEARSSQHAS